MAAIRDHYDIMDIITATHNLHRFVCLIGFTTDEQLREFTIKNEFLADMEGWNEKLKSSNPLFNGKTGYLNLLLVGSVTL